ncbi:hypothetical protein Ciccas_010936 [Cichlidogyrus casuarinus]|uniref:Uncharacterized protein n=1 Tax=Cichlidogyrus casuarinus TaxID=1844966 RepID=A0ABD2PSQ0_9PLAT
MLNSFLFVFMLKVDNTNSSTTLPNTSANQKNDTPSMEHMKISKSSLVVFMVCSVIMFLTFFGSLPFMLKSLWALLREPGCNLTKVIYALREHGQEKLLSSVPNRKGDSFMDLELGGTGNTSSGRKNLFNRLQSQSNSRNALKDAESIAKQEFQRICETVNIFDMFSSTQQTRLVVMLDARSIKNRDALFKLIYRINSLLLLESNAPVAIIIAARFKTLLSEYAIDPSQSVFSNMDASSGAMANGRSHAQSNHSTLFEPLTRTRALNDSFHLVHSSLHLPIYLYNSPERKHEIALLEASHKIQLIQSSVTINGVMVNLGVTDDHSLLEPQMSHDLGQSKSTGKTGGIADLFLQKVELNEFNLKVLKSLTKSLLSSTEYGLTNLLLDDRSPDRLEAFVEKECKGRFSLADLYRLNAFSFTMNPYLYSTMRGIVSHFSSLILFLKKTFSNGWVLHLRTQYPTLQTRSCL